MPRTGLIALLLLVTATALPQAARADTATPDFQPGWFVPVDPLRVLDTRATRPIGPGATLRADLSQRLPLGTTAVVLNITGSDPTADTHLTASPVGAQRVGPTLTLRPRENRLIQVTVGVNQIRGVDLYNAAGSTHVIADLVGYYKASAGAGFHGVTQHRVLDTRSGTSLGPASSRTVGLGGRLPADAVAVTFNLIATEPTSATHLVAWPTGRARPTASNINVVAGETRANLVTVAVGANRSVDIYNHLGRTHVILELAGYYTQGSGSAFRARLPVREYDSRRPYPNGMPGLPIPSRSRVAFSVADAVPPTTTGVLLNVTGIDPSATTWLTVWGNADTPRPDVATVHVPLGRTVANAAVVGMAPRDLTLVYNQAGRVHATVDLMGAFVDVGASAA